MLLRALLLFFFFVFLARAVWRLVEGIARGAMGGPQQAARAGGRQAPTAVKMTPCPVCGTYVVPGKALSAVSRGQVLHFCSETCRNAHAA